MDRKVLVAQIHRLERQIRRNQGPVALLMLVSPDPAVDDEWNIVVSAKGFNRVSRADAIRQVTVLMRQALARDLWPRIRRVTVFRTDDPFVAAMTSAFRTSKSVVDLQSCNVIGFEIPKGVLFTSKKVAA